MFSCTDKQHGQIMEFMNIPLNGQSLQKQIPYSCRRMAALGKWKEYELQSILRSSNQVKGMIFSEGSPGKAAGQITESQIHS